VLDLGEVVAVEGLLTAANRADMGVLAGGAVSGVAGLATNAEVGDNVPAMNRAVATPRGQLRAQRPVHGFVDVNGCDHAGVVEELGLVLDVAAGERFPAVVDLVAVEEARPVGRVGLKLQPAQHPSPQLSHPARRTLTDELLRHLVPGTGQPAVDTL
jgi:hypothetical protein